MTVGWTVIGDHRYATKTLVERLRRFRGKATLAQMCDETGGTGSRSEIEILRKLCHRFEVAFDERPYETGFLKEKERLKATRKTQREALLAAADRARREQIALAVSERDTAPLYRGGDLNW